MPAALPLPVGVRRQNDVYGELLSRPGSSRPRAQRRQLPWPHGGGDHEPTGQLLGNVPQAFSHVGLVNAAYAIGTHLNPTKEQGEM